jgi:hypothetical protein
LNQTRAHPGIARESKFQGPGINELKVPISGQSKTKAVVTMPTNREVRQAEAHGGCASATPTVPGTASTVAAVAAPVCCPLCNRPEHPPPARGKNPAYSQTSLGEPPGRPVARRRARCESLVAGSDAPGGNTSIMLGLSDANGNPNFAPQGEGYQIRAIQLERGPMTFVLSTYQMVLAGGDGSDPRLIQLPGQPRPPSIDIGSAKRHNLRIVSVASGQG